MVDITPAVSAARYLTEGYGDGGFRINGERTEGAILLHGQLIEPWSAEGGIDEAAVTALADWISRTQPRAEILLIGTGADMTFLPRPLLQPLRDMGVSVDFMDTGAACRTFNVLITEERRVALAALPVG